MSRFAIYACRLLDLLCVAFAGIFFALLEYVPVFFICLPAECVFFILVDLP
jgi:hypothetical protein